MAHLGPSRWDDAVVLLDEALWQGQGFNIRRRVYYFTDWIPLKGHPGFKRVLEPGDSTPSGGCTCCYPRIPD